MPADLLLRILLIDEVYDERSGDLLMKNWLQNFAYRASIDAWIFVLAGGAALAIAMITVSYQSLRAALANPIDALKYE